MSLATARYAASLAHPIKCPLCGTRSEANTITLPGMRIDRQAQRAWIAGHELKLTRREHELLAYFADRHDRVVTKRDLLIDIWGYQAVPRTTRAVEAHVSRLRRKIAATTGDTTYFPSVWGIGWRLRFESGC